MTKAGLIHSFSNLWTMVDAARNAVGFPTPRDAKNSQFVGMTCILVVDQKW